MKRMVAYLAALVAVGGIVGYASLVRAQQPGAAPPAAAAQPQARSKIALVNIAKVLKNYHKANFQGKEIQAKKQYYIDRVNAVRTQVAEKTKQHAASQVPADRDRLEKEIRDLQRQGEDVEREAQKVLGELSNTTVVQVYKEICSVIDAYAAAHGYELILCYPDASNPTDASSVMVAQLKLQTPALMPFYHSPGMDLTDGVIATLNARYPAPQQPAAHGSTPAPAANGNGQPPARPQQ